MVRIKRENEKRQDVSQCSIKSEDMLHHQVSSLFSPLIKSQVFLPQEYLHPFVVTDRGYCSCFQGNRKTQEDGWFTKISPELSRLLITAEADNEFLWESRQDCLDERSNVKNP